MTSSAPIAVTIASAVALPAFEDAERQMRAEQDARDEQRRQVAVVERQEPLAASRRHQRRPAPSRRRRRQPAIGLLHVVQLCRSADCSIVCCCPDGQRITTRSTAVASPSP